MSMTAPHMLGGPNAQPSVERRLSGTDPGFLQCVHNALIRRPKFRRVPIHHLELLVDRGLAHDHVRIRGTGLLLRLPKQSQMALDPFHNLAYQAACFDRSAHSGHVPLIHGALSPMPELPLGALIVQEIFGRTAELPKDLTAIVAALATIHSLPVPPTNRRRPLINHADPVGEMLEEIDEQAVHLGEAGLTDRAATLIRAELDAAHAHVDAVEPPEIALISFDAHPGNFVMEPHGRAVLVDLEKARYGAPAYDLAHATLYTSTTWDTDVQAVLSPEEIAGAYAAWLAAVPPRLADRSRPSLLSLRRLMWLWSVTWCAKWRALSTHAPKTADDPSSEDWSSALSSETLVAHVADRVADYLSVEGIERVCEDWRGDHALTGLLGRLA